VLGRTTSKRYRQVETPETHMTDRELLELIREGRYRELLYDLELEFPELIRSESTDERARSERARSDD
jgi:hypothetical protein